MAKRKKPPTPKEVIDVEFVRLRSDGKKDKRYGGKNTHPPGQASKWPTFEQRRAACDRLCKHLADGYSLECWPDADRKTIERYMTDFPEDFPQEEVETAYRQGMLLWEQYGKLGAMGKVQGFNSAVWIFTMKNKAKWSDHGPSAASAPDGGVEKGNEPMLVTNDLYRLLSMNLEGSF